MAEQQTETTSTAALHSVDANVQELLALAERLKEQTGGDLDDAALSAVAEATGAPIEYVRVAMLRPTQQSKPRGWAARIKAMALSFDPSARLYITNLYLACFAGFFAMLTSALRDPGEFFTIVTIGLAATAAYLISRGRDQKSSSLAGAIFGVAYFVSSALFTTIASWITGRSVDGSPAIAVVFAGAVGYFVGGWVWTMRNGTKRASQQALVSTQTSERQRLLAQLIELQDKLRASEQNLSFLSLDVVGSTRMKELADPLAVEFTFTEYHRYVETIAMKHGGRIHSTAGDGVICAFDTPQQAFNAARNIQSGLIELNTHRNRLGTPIRLRAGIHYGTVMPTGTGVQSVTFAHVIDIASHLQKECPPDSIAVSEAAGRLLVGGLDAVGTETVRVHNTNGRIWTGARPLAETRPKAPEFDASQPPPLV